MNLLGDLISCRTFLNFICLYNLTHENTEDQLPLLPKYIHVGDKIIKKKIESQQHTWHMHHKTKNVIVLCVICLSGKPTSTCDIVDCSFVRPKNDCSLLSSWYHQFIVFIVVSFGSKYFYKFSTLFESNYLISVFCYRSLIAKIKSNLNKLGLSCAKLSTCLDQCCLIEISNKI